MLNNEPMIASLQTMDHESTRGSLSVFLLDLSTAGNSAQACLLVDHFVATLSEKQSAQELSLNSNELPQVAINAGDLLLTRAVLSKMKQQIQRGGSNLQTLYASVPQTQQAALDEGLLVKEKMDRPRFPLRQAFPLGRSAKEGSSKEAVNGATLPQFGQVSLAATPSTSNTLPLENVVSPPLQTDVSEVVSKEESTLAESMMETNFFESAFNTAANDNTEASPVHQAVSYSLADLETLYLHQHLRSGQSVRFEGHIIIVGDVHAGSEITAGGDILVWGELRGIAHAGAQGNEQAEIRALKIEALQLRIADHIARRPDRIFYHKTEEELNQSPELAKVSGGEIKIFKTSHY